MNTIFLLTAVNIIIYKSDVKIEILKPEDLRWCIAEGVNK